LFRPREWVLFVLVVGISFGLWLWLIVSVGTEFGTAAACLGFVLVTVAMFVWFVRRAVRTRRDSARLRQVGFPTLAEIVDVFRWQEPDSFAVRFIVDYRYQAMGRERAGHGERLMNPGVKVGDHITILYDPADPDVNIWPTY
jgi:hypothetical protein